MNKLYSLNYFSIMLFTSMIILTILLYFGIDFLNRQSPSISARDGSISINTDTLKDSLYLLDGEWAFVENENGGKYIFVLEMEGSKQYGLYVRSLQPPNFKNIFINGTQIREDVYQQNFFVDFNNDAGDTRYEIIVEVDQESQFQRTLGIFLGTESVIRNASNAITFQRMLVVGFCLAVIISCLLLYFNKRSEKYLLMLAFLLLFTVLKILGKAFDIFKDVPIFDFVFGNAVAIPYLNSELSLFVVLALSLIITTHLRCGVFEQFVSVKISGVKYPYLVDFFAVLMGVLSITTKFESEIAVIWVYIAAFLFEAWVFIQWSKTASNYFWLFSIAWALTVSMYLYSQSIIQRSLPMGMVNSLLSFPTYHNLIYTLVFLVMTYSIFAKKYQQVDQMTVKLQEYSSELDSIIREQTAEIRASHEKLQLELQRKNNFIQMIAHNMKTPLFTILGSAEMSKGELSRDLNKADAHLDTIVNNSNHVNKMIEKLMLVSRFDSGAVKIIPSYFNVCQFIESIRASSEVKAKEQSVSLVKTSNPDSIFITADEFYLRQAVQDIVDNAIESCDAGGRVELSCELKDDAVWITIRDDGCGMSENELDHIFDLYYSKNKNRDSSTGLGLSIARRIVQLHFGEIRVESEMAHGSVFHVIIPSYLPNTLIEP